MKVAMVCMGNICRSPMAEHVLRGKAVAAGLDLEVASAGTGSWHVGEPAHPRTAELLSANGYTSDHKAKQFTTAWFNDFDLILVMDNDNLRTVRALAPSVEDASRVKLLLDYHPTSTDGAEVPDPYYGTMRDYEHCLALIEPACDALVAELQRGY